MTTPLAAPSVDWVAQTPAVSIGPWCPPEVAHARVPLDGAVCPDRPARHPTSFPRSPPCCGVPKVKSAVETLSPTRVKLTVEVPFDGAEADARRRRTAASVPRCRSPASARARCRAGSSSSVSAVARGVQEAVNQALPPFYAEAIEAENVRAARPARGRRHRRARSPTVTTSSSPPRPTCAPRSTCPTSRTSPSRSTRSRPSDEAVQQRLAALRARFGALRRRARRRGRRLRVHRPGRRIEDEKIDSVTGVSYEVGGKNSSTVSTTLSSACPPTRPPPSPPPSPVVTARATRPLHRHRSRGQGPRAARARRRVRPARLRVRHPRRAAAA